MSGVSVSRSGGVYISIAGDLSGLRDDLKEANGIARSAAADISKSFSSALTANQVQSTMQGVAASIAKVNAAAKAMKTDLGQHAQTFRDMGKALGVAEKDLNKFAATQAKALQTKLVKEHERAVKDLSRALGDDTGYKKAAAGADSLTASLKAAAPQIAAVVVAYKALKSAAAAVGDFVNSGIEYNKQLQNAQLGISTVIALNNKIFDTQGRMLQGQEKFNAAQKISVDIVKQLDAATVSFSGEFSQLLSGFQSAFGFAQSKGIDWKSTIEMVKLMGNTMKAANLDLNTLDKEMKRFLTGKDLNNSDVLKMLSGISAEMVKTWGTGEQFVRNFTKALEDSQYAGEAAQKTYESSMSAVKENVQSLAAETTKPLFDALAESAYDFANALFVIDKTTGTWTVHEDIQPLVDLGKDLAHVIGTLVVNAVSAATTALQGLGRLVAALRENWRNRYANIAEDALAESGLDEESQAKIRASLQKLGEGGEKAGQAIADGMNAAGDATKNAGEGVRLVSNAIASVDTKAVNQARKNMEDYDAAIARAKASIKSLGAQLATGKHEAFTRESIAINEKYEETITNIDKEINKMLVDKKGISKADAESLREMKKQEASLQKQLDLKKAEEKEEQRLAQLASDRYQFYKELEEISGRYGLSLKYQVQLLDEQAKKLRQLGIPEKYIQQWEKLKKLQTSRDFTDGITRAFMKFRAEAEDLGKQAESTFSSLFSGLDSSFKSMWEGIIENGKLSLASFKDMFKSFLADLAHMAITRPIAISIAGAVTGLFGGNANANAGSGLLGLFSGDSSSAMSSLAGNAGLIAALTSIADGGSSVTVEQQTAAANALSTLAGNGSNSIASLASNISSLKTVLDPSTYTAAFDKITSLFSSGTGAISYHGTTAAATVVIDDLAYQELAQLGKDVSASVATEAASNTLSSVLGAAGAVLAGYSAWSSVTGYMAAQNPLKYGTKQAETGGMIGGALGAIGGAAVAVAGGISSGMTMGATIGSIWPGVGTAIGAAIGAAIGMMAGASDNYDLPAMDMSGRGYLGNQSYSYADIIPYIDDNINHDPAITLTLWKELFGEEFSDNRRNEWTNGKTPRTWLELRDNFLLGSTTYNMGGKTPTYREQGDLITQAILAQWDATTEYAEVTADALNAIGQKQRVAQDKALGSVQTLATGYTQDQNLNLGTQFLDLLGQQEIQFEWTEENLKAGGQFQAFSNSLQKQTEAAMGYAFSQLDFSDIADKFVVNVTDYGPQTFGKYAWSDESTAFQVNSYGDGGEGIGMSAAFDTYEQALIGTEELYNKYMELIDSHSIETGMSFEKWIKTSAQTHAMDWNQYIREYKNDDWLKNRENYDEMIKLLTNQMRAQSMIAATESLYDSINHITTLQEQAKEQIDAIQKWVDESINGGTDEDGNQIAPGGFTEEYANQLARDFYDGVIWKMINSVELAIRPASQLEQAFQGVNSQFEDLTRAAEMLGATQEDLIRIEKLRLESLEQARVAMLQPIYQDFNLRVASLLPGGDAQGLQLQYTHQQQRTDMISKVGADSPEMKALLAIQEAERLAHEANLAQAAYDNLASELAQMESSVKNATAAVESARLAFVHELIAALDTAYNGIQQAVDAWYNGAKSAFDSAANEYASSLQSSLNTFKSVADKLRQARSDIWADSTLTTPETAYASTKADMDRLYSLALGGDTDAATEFSSAAKMFLDASYASQGDYGAYLGDFAAVHTMLAALEAEAQAQADGIQTELEVLQSQYGVAVKNSKTLEEQKDAMLAAYADFREAEAERQAAYQRWGFEDVVPGIEGLKVAYYDAVAAYEKAQQDIRDAILAGITTQGEIDSLRVVSKLDELKAQMAAAQAEQSKYSQELITIQAGAVEAARIAAEAAKAAALAAAGEAANAVKEAEATSKPGIYGSKYATEYDLLAAKAASLNRGEYFGSDIDPNIVWTATTVKEGMSSEGMTVAEWYERHGKLEGFADGGIATPGWAMVGEDGPELVNFSSRAAVFPADVTRRILGPAESDGSPAGDNALLQATLEQNAILREQNARLAILASVAQRTDRSTSQVAESVEFLVERAVRGDGTTPTRTSIPKTGWAQ